MPSRNKNTVFNCKYTFYSTIVNKYLIKIIRYRVIYKLSSVYRMPAMQAVIKQTIAPVTNDLNTKAIIIGRFPGINVDMLEIMIPIALGLEKPQIAKVAMACDLGWKKQASHGTSTLARLHTHRQFPIPDHFPEDFVSVELVDDGLHPDESPDVSAFLPGYPHKEAQRHEDVA